MRYDFQFKKCLFVQQLLHLSPIPSILIDQLLEDFLWAKLSPKQFVVSLVVSTSPIFC